MYKKENKHQDKSKNKDKIDLNKLPDLMYEKGISKRVALSMLIDKNCVYMDKVAAPERKGKK